MTTVALIVTGDLEYVALPASLTRVFPSLTFVLHASPPGAPMPGFTSNQLRGREPVLSARSPDGDLRPSMLARLVDQLILAVHPGRNGKPYDYAILLDDLELANAGQPELVVEHVRHAVPSRIQTQWPSQAKRDQVTELVRERCSFHLLSPMVESYFFCEPAALDRAGRIADRPSLVDPSARDVEDFLVDDPVYEKVPLPQGTTKRSAPRDWRRSPEQRPRHPKKYVQYLADHQLDGQTDYDETTRGRRALESLDWSRVLRPQTSARMIRSLFADLARIGPPARPSLSPQDDGCSPFTWRPGARDRVLRNV